MIFLYVVFGFLISSCVFVSYMYFYQRNVKNKLFNVLKLNYPNYLKYFVNIANKSRLNIYNLINLIEDKLKRIYDNYDDLRKYQSVLYEVIESVDNGILIIDKCSRINYVNAVAGVILNIENVNEICGKCINDTELKWILKFDNLKVFEIPGEYTNLSILCYVKSFMGEFKIYKFKNVSEYKRLDYMSTEFISNITHELKTPLTSIIGFSETLRNVEEEDERQIFYDIINKEAVRLNNLISDILVFSEIETQSDTNRKKIDIIKMLNEIKQLLSPQITKIDFEIKILDDNKVVILNNERYLRQIFINIIDNSIKHSFGTILRVECFDNDDEVHVDFCDNGIGIPDEDIKNIFSRFYKVPGSKSKSRGTGLGLSIVENFITKINGRIDVFNNEKGITFRVVIPKNRE